MTKIEFYYYKVVTIFCVEICEQCFEIRGSNRDSIDQSLNKAKDK